MLCWERNFMFYFAFPLQCFRAWNSAVFKNCYEDLSAAHDHWKRTDLTRQRDLNLICWNTQILTPWHLVMLNAFVPVRVARLWATNWWHKSLHTVFMLLCLRLKKVHSPLNLQALSGYASFCHHWCMWKQANEGEKPIWGQLWNRDLIVLICKNFRVINLFF